LSGLGGAGKTSVAVEYAYRHLAEVGVAWQVACENTTVLAAGFGELAAQLGARELADTRDPVASVHAVLAAFQAGWMLIFDNAADLASVEAFLPPAGPGRVLITSRNALWPPGKVLDVPVLSPDIAAEFLVTRTGQPDRQSALELAREVGGLPLALEQAGAYVQASGGSLAGYLALFRRRRPEMLARGGTGEYGETVATTWSLAFTDLEQSAPQAAGLLRLLAFCAPEAVPLRLLLQPRPGLADDVPAEVAAVLVPLLVDELAVGDAVAALRRYSLVTPAGDGLVLVHRLVQAVTADQMPKELRDAWHGAAGAAIEAALPEDPLQPDSWPDFAVLLPHAQAGLSADSPGMQLIGAYLAASGSYVAAREFSQRMLEAQVRALGPEHPQTLATRIGLAGFTGLAGDAVGARDQLAALLPVIERVFGPEDPATLATAGALARWTGEAGDPVGARDQIAVLLPVIERVLGPEDPVTLFTVGTLAFWSEIAGDAASDPDQLAAALPVVERVLGPEHPQTLIAAETLATFIGMAGDVAGARDRYAALLPVYERVLGPEHPQTLTAATLLAGWTGEAGDAAGARDQLAASLPVMERVLGPEHPHTLMATDSLASWTGEAGDATGARDRYAALLPVYERVYGPEHPDTLTARANVAYWTGEVGDAAGARDQYAALLPIRERVLGPEHPDTLTARANVAYWTGQAGDAAGLGVD
jgi:hypothetical protein